MMKTKTKFVQSSSLLIILFFISRNVLSQTVEDIYIQLPEKYIHSPLSVIAEKNSDQNVLDKKTLKRLLSMDVSEINKLVDIPFQIASKIVDNKNNYIQFCDMSCTWEFTMKVFNDKNNKPAYIAIWEGNNDGATSFSNKEFHFLMLAKKRNTFTFKDVREKLEPFITCKEIISPALYQKYKPSIDKSFDNYNLIDCYILDQYHYMITGVIYCDVTFFEEEEKEKPQEIKMIIDSIYNKQIEFKWDGEKFNRINFKYLIE